TFPTMNAVAERRNLSARGFEPVDMNGWGRPDENVSRLQKVSLTIYRLLNHIYHIFKQTSCLPKEISKESLDLARQQYVGDAWVSGATILDEKSAKVSAELAPRHINLYFQEILSRELSGTPYNYVGSFLEPDFTIQAKNAHDILNELQPPSSNINPNLPTVMPFVIPKSRFSENHVVLIVIKDNTICYVDPKGPTIDDQKTKDGVLLKELLAKAFPGKEIVQNSVVHQECITNCGAYVCKFARDILKDNFNLSQRFGLKDIIDFRNDMFREFYNLFINQVPRNQATNTPHVDEDFEMDS
ncbi:MAG: hypothetical protein ACHQUC_08120, partial [Chlamydiales bacterium]